MKGVAYGREQAEHHPGTPPGLRGFFPPVLYSYSLGGKDFLLELIKQRELNSLRVVFMSEKGQGLQPYQMQEKWE